MQTTNTITGITGTSTGTACINTWNHPIRMRVNECFESIEMIYKETSMMTYTTYPPQPPEERVFKIVHSCIDGKWHKSDRIYGVIIPAREEYYEFNT